MDDSSCDRTQYGTLALGIPLSAMFVGWAATRSSDEPLTNLVFSGFSLLAILVGLGFSAAALVQGCRGRESLPKAICVGMLNVFLVGACVFGFLYGREKVHRQKQALAMLDRQREKTIDKLAAGEDLTSTDVRNMAAVIQKVADLSTGPLTEQKAIRAINNALVKFSEQAAKYAAMVEQIEKNGGIISSKLTSLDAIARQMNVVQSLADQNNRLVNAGSNLPATLKDLLARNGVDEPNRSQIVNRVFAPSTLELSIKVRQLDQSAFLLYTRQLQLLKDSWGRWHMDAQTGSVVFQDEATMNTFNSLSGQIAAICEQQERLQQEIVATLRQQTRNSVATRR